MSVRLLMIALAPMAMLWLGSCQAVDAPRTRQATYDLVIRNGQIMDGSGEGMFRADVGIRDGVIAFIGRIPSGGGETELDAANEAVAPGFIDVHTHVDDDIGRLRLAENFVRDGVTTVITGNCGESVRDIRAFLARIQSRGAGVNIATLVGQNTILRNVKGDRAGDLTHQQMQQAKGLVRQAMLDGALGMSTGLIYAPGSFSSTAEIIELQKVAAEHGGIYATHMRSEGEGILRAIDEAIAVAREARCRLQISHFKLSSDLSKSMGGPGIALSRIDRARRSGVEIWLDQYPYAASSTTIETLIPDGFLADGSRAARGRLDDSREVERLILAMREFHEVQRNRRHLGYVVISTSEGYPQWAGLNLIEVAQRMKLSAGRGFEVDPRGVWPMRCRRSRWRMNTARSSRFSARANRPAFFTA